jgi:hypothetical protein
MLLRLEFAMPSPAKSLTALSLRRSLQGFESAPLEQMKK